MLSGRGRQRARPGEVINDPVRRSSRRSPTRSKVESPTSCSSAPTTAAARSRSTADNKTITPGAGREGARRDRHTDAKVTINGQNVTVTVDKLPTSPSTDVTQSSRSTRASNVSDVSVTTVGPTWGPDVSRKAVKALIFFFILLALYLTFRFEWKMSAAAIVAVIHDIIFTRRRLRAVPFRSRPRPSPRS